MVALAGERWRSARHVRVSAWRGWGFEGEGEPVALVVARSLLWAPKTSIVAVFGAHPQRSQAPQPRGGSPCSLSESHRRAAPTKRPALSTPGPQLAGLPAREVLALHLGQLVDLDAQRGELEQRDLAIDRVRHRMDARGEGFATQDELLAGQRVDRERDVHDRGRMALARREVDDSPACEQVQPAAVDDVLVDERQHGAALVTEVRQRDLDVEVACVGQDRAVL